jgi:hypothetical protein
LKRILRPTPDYSLKALELVLSGPVDSADDGRTRFEEDKIPDKVDEDDTASSEWERTYQVSVLEHTVKHCGAIGECTATICLSGNQEFGGSGLSVRFRKRLDVAPSEAAYGAFTSYFNTIVPFISGVYGLVS